MPTMPWTSHGAQGLSRWEEMPTWEQDAASTVCERVRGFLNVSSGSAAELSRDRISAVGVIGGGSPTLLQVLEVVDRDGPAVLCDRLPEPKLAKGSTGRLRDDHLRTDFGKRLRSLVEVTIADAARGGWPLSWSHGQRFEIRTELLPEGLADRLKPAVEAVVASRPSTTELRELVRQSS